MEGLHTDHNWEDAYGRTLMVKADGVERPLEREKDGTTEKHNRQMPGTPRTQDVNVLNITIVQKLPLGYLYKSNLFQIKINENQNGHNLSIS